MKKFNEYKSARDLYEFDKKFDVLCESIFKSGLTFEQYWKNFALPVLIESNSFEDENQLLNEISYNPLNWFRKNPSNAAQPPDLTNPANTTDVARNSSPEFGTYSNVTNAVDNPNIDFDALSKFKFPNPDTDGGNFQARNELEKKLKSIFKNKEDENEIQYIGDSWMASENGFHEKAVKAFENLKNKYTKTNQSNSKFNTTQNMANSMPNSNFDNRSINTEDPAIQDPNMTPERQKKLAAFQQKADQQINQIKSDFKVAMRSFLKQASDQAKDQGDHHMWQIAQVFYKKIMDTSSPIIDGFKLKAKFGKPAYKEPFTKERDAMQMNRTNSLKSNLQSNRENLIRSAQQRKDDKVRQDFQNSPDFPGRGNS